MQYSRGVWLLPFFIAAAMVAVSSQAGAQAGKPMMGKQLLTEQERSAHRSQMQAATTPEQRQQICAAHRALMQQRAAEKGVEMPGPMAMGGCGKMAGKGHCGDGMSGQGPMHKRGMGHGPRHGMGGQGAMGCGRS